jgi:hypothetical protein
MVWAEFEEKVYELAVGVELAARGDAVFSSGQVLEHVLGYDAAAAPDPEHVIWRLLDIPRPAGLRLLSGLWEPESRPAPADLPTHPVSVLLQYKRPERLRGARAAQWNLWHRPYFRFTRLDRQHAVLRSLERSLGDSAIVRYAAPAFWRRGDLEVAHLRREVLDRSGLVSPEAIGGHRVWTYVRPGTEGIPNPRGKARMFETFAGLFETISSGGPAGRDLISLRGEASCGPGFSWVDALDTVGPRGRRRKMINRGRGQGWPRMPTRGARRSSPR